MSSIINWDYYDAEYESDRVLGHDLYDILQRETIVPNATDEELDDYLATADIVDIFDCYSNIEHRITDARFDLLLRRDPGYVTYLYRGLKDRITDARFEYMIQHVSDEMLECDHIQNRMTDEQFDRCVRAAPDHAFTSPLVHASRLTHEQLMYCACYFNFTIRSRISLVKIEILNQYYE